MMKAFNTVILIDDDGLSNYVSEMTIKVNNFGKEIFTFMTAKGAFSFLEKAVENEGIIQFPAVIFLDITMPELDGWDFLNAYRILPVKIKEKLQLYILSSSVDERDILKSKLHPDVCGFISKPLSREILSTIKVKEEQISKEKTG